MSLWRKFLLFSAVFFILSFSIAPAWAHHMTGGELPKTFLAGFMSGLAHPIIGLDHLATIVAVGILGVLRPLGILIPIGFIVATSCGTGLHLVGIEISFLELVIATSILFTGVTIVLKDQLKIIFIDLIPIGMGIFHGYAYGESIFGAESTPLVSYLFGFSLIQCAIAMGVFLLVKKISSVDCRSIGFVISGIGIAFVFNQLIQILLPGA